MFEHEAFELTGGDRYWIAGLCFLEWVAFCHNNLVSLEGALRAVFKIIDF